MNHETALDGPTSCASRFSCSPRYTRDLTLQSSLTYQPRELKFGTSGRRGEVIHLTDLEIYLNVLAELEYLQSLAPDAGGIIAGDPFFFASDLRPSSAQLSHAVERAIRDAGMHPINLGPIPTPALMYFAVSRRCASIMVTGSHIPFDRNGYKLNTSRGELLKDHEVPVNQAVERVRRRLYEQPAKDSIFAPDGSFKFTTSNPAPVSNEAEPFYINRYIEFFGTDALGGLKLAVYQHSAVGRDLLFNLLERLGAIVYPCGRSDQFVPIDTENIDAAQLEAIQKFARDVIAQKGHLDAVVSTDGDSDRPLILGVEPASGTVRFYGGDLVGMPVAEFLRADAVVVPITCNDAIDRGKLAHALQPKTRIGSPYVIAGMQQASRLGRRVICGWEANGGFLTGSDIARNGRVLKALPTRDAMLPIAAVLASAKASGKSLIDLFAGLPRRYSSAALLKNYPRSESRAVVEHLSIPGDATRKALEQVFNRDIGFSAISRLDYTDGVRIYFNNGDVVHFRPSGNADEFRIYAVADSQARANEITAAGVAEPQGLLRQLAKFI